MNREILFRGQYEKGKWVFGHYAYFVNYPDSIKKRWILNGQSEDGKRGDFDIDPATLGQYIGITDKFDDKIFEGDIAGSDTQGFGVVSWHQEKLMYCLKYKSIDGDLLFFRELSPIDFIVGNIHDNPELL